MINIAIDGSSSSGKSTLAKELALKLGYKRLDTGAIYRGIACAFLRMGLKKVGDHNISRLVKNLQIKVRFVGDQQKVMVNGYDETPNLRTEQISLLTSEISPYKKVRDEVLDLQRDFAKKYDCVMEGRDITTTVLPNATVKLYVTATLEERARRRYLQFVGKKDAPTFEQVLADLKLRDERDSNRTFGRLEIAPDAIVVDTTGKNIAEMTNYCLEIINKKIM